MSGSILYRKTSTGKRRISALRINGREESVVHWSRVSGRKPTEIIRRLNTMSPYDAVFEGAFLETETGEKVQPANAWPVPSSTRITKHTGS